MARPEPSRAVLSLAVPCRAELKRPPQLTEVEQRRGRSSLLLFSGPVLFSQKSDRCFSKPAALNLTVRPQKSSVRNMTARVLNMVSQILFP